jgi:porphobilinogen synthase
MFSFPGRSPWTRPRRLRQKDWTRALVRESSLKAEDLIWPLFISEGEKVREPIGSMPGVFRLSIDQVLVEAERAAKAGIPAVALFPRTPLERKSEDGREAHNPENLINRTTRAIKAAGLPLGVICDVALDPYTSHGHDGLLRDVGHPQR